MEPLEVLDRVKVPVVKGLGDLGRGKAHLGKGLEGLGRTEVVSAGPKGRVVH